MIDLDFLAIAHRGLTSDSCPENSLEAIQAAIDADLDGIEIDVHLAKGGIPVVVHDATVQRKPVAEMSISELKKIGIPTLEEILSLDRGDRILMVELKEEGHSIDELCKNTLDLIADKNSGPLVIGSLSPDIIGRLRGEADEVIGIAEDVESIGRYMKWQIPLVAISDEIATRQRIETLLSEDIEVWVWTINEVDRLEELVRYGVTGIISDTPLFTDL